ncbi:hypothetical protein SCAR479_08793 [Seiridium cardinale]|uniref:Uncharacterized protein n=1 Tax=Seiridium cardinale TaxID=138064 RepID=A0ABR2XLE5_9PEZI
MCIKTSWAILDTPSRHIASTSPVSLTAAISVSYDAFTEDFSYRMVDGPARSLVANLILSLSLRRFPWPGPNLLDLGQADQSGDHSQAIAPKCLGQDLHALTSENLDRVRLESMRTCKLKL